MLNNFSVIANTGKCMISGSSGTADGGYPRALKAIQRCEREKKRIRLEKKYALKRTNLLADYKQEENFSKKLEIHSKIQQLPRNSAKTRIRNRCWKTGRPRGVFRDFGVSRHVLREMAHQCLLPGVTKSSW